MPKNHLIETGGRRISAIWDAPGRGMRFALLLAHGAGTDKDHPGLARLARALTGAGVGVLRFNFPYKELGRKAPDRAPVLTAAWRDVLAWFRGRSEGKGLPVIAAGRSMGGRMASLAAAEAEAGEGAFDPDGLVYYAYPLHPPGRKDRLRRDHLAAIRIPMLFLSGTRDSMADPDLLEETVRGLRRKAALHWIQNADHGYRVLKRSGRTFEDVIEEAAGETASWAERVLLRGRTR